MKLKIVIVDFEIPPKLKRRLLVLGIPLIAVVGSLAASASVPVTFAPGEVMKSADLNTDLANLDSRLATLESAVPTIQSNVSSLQTSLSGLQGAVFTTVFASYLNTTDDAGAEWEPFAATCLQQLNLNGGTCTGNGCGSIPLACTIGAERKCVTGLGYRFGFFNGETNANGVSILCVE